MDSKMETIQEIIQLNMQTNPPQKTGIKNIPTEYKDIEHKKAMQTCE